MNSINSNSWVDVPGGYTGHVKYTNGIQEWYKNGQRHREDGPAIINPNGTQYWYLNGKLHRDDGPAIIYPNGDQSWYKDGAWHREDGPAEIWSDGTTHYWLDGKNYSRENYYRELHKRGIITEQELFVELL